MAMTLFTFVLNDVVVPRSQRYAEVSLKRALGRSLASETGRDVIYPRFGRRIGSDGERGDKGLLQLFYSRKFQNGQMLDVTVLDFTRPGLTQMLRADRAIWNEAPSQLGFLDGQILTLAANGSSTKADFDRYVYPLLVLVRCAWRALRKMPST